MSADSLYHSLLREALPIQSVSTDPAYQNEMKRMADWLKKQFRARGFRAETVKGYGNPVVLARYEVDPSAETLLVYGHYDVQPAVKGEGWTAEPFSYYQGSGRIYGRGVSDNKGQVLMHIATAFELIEHGELSYNLLFLIEGDEETGSSGLEQFLRDRRSQLQADAALVSDGTTPEQRPTLELGFRGTFNAAVRIQTAPSDLHSGLFGGAVPNAAHLAARLIDRLRDKRGRVAVPGFYDGVKTPGRTDRQVVSQTAERRFLKLAGVKTRSGETRFDHQTQTGRRPALEVTGLESGYTGEGYRNSIPATAQVKLNIRLVAGQDPKAIQKNLKRFARELLPEARSVACEFERAVPAALLAEDSPFIARAVEVLRRAGRREPTREYCGGTLPIATYFERTLKLPQVYVPLANEDCRMHGVDENLTLSQLRRGLNFSRQFLGKK